MVIGILVFNKLVSKDGITDMKLKERAGYALKHTFIFIQRPLTSLADCGWTVNFGVCGWTAVIVFVSK